MENSMPLVKIAKRARSKRLSFIERAQKESEELLRNMGGSFELEGGRRTRSSTRGTTSSSLAAMITPLPAKRSRKSPNVTAANVTPARPPRVRGRKLEGMTSQVEVQDSKNSSTLNSNNNNNKTKSFPEVKASDVLKPVPVEDTENVDISLEQGDKENQQTTSKESKRSIDDDEKSEKLNPQEETASGIDKPKDINIDVTETDNEKIIITEDKPDGEMVSATVTAADRVRDNKNVDSTMEQSSEEEKPDDEAHETPNEIAASPREMIAKSEEEDDPKEIQQSTSDKTIADVGNTTTIKTNTTIDTNINPTTSLPSVINIEETVELSEDDVQKEDEPDNNLIMEIDSDDNSSQLKAEESKSIATDDANAANVVNTLAKPSESKELDSCKESTNSTEKSLQMDTINLDDSSIESEKQNVEKNIKKSSNKAIEKQSTAIEHEISVDKETITMPAVHITDDAISLDYDTDNFSNKSESNVNDLKIVDDIETDDVDDALSDDVKSINENKLGAEEEINDETVANGSSFKLVNDNKSLAEGSSNAITTTSTTPTTTTA